MILWNDIPVKHSILMAGEAVDIEMIGAFLKDGIKVIWFGTDQDRDLLKQKFEEYVRKQRKEYFNSMWFQSLERVSCNF